jgi:hypothetical protein
VPILRYPRCLIRSLWLSAWNLSVEAGAYDALHDRPYRRVGIHREPMQDESLRGGHECTDGIRWPSGPDAREKGYRPFDIGRPLLKQWFEQLRVVGALEEQCVSRPGTTCKQRCFGADEAGEGIDQLINSRDRRSSTSVEIVAFPLRDPSDDACDEGVSGTEPIRGGSLRQTGSLVHARVDEGADSLLADELEGCVESALAGGGHAVDSTRLLFL